MGTYTSILTTFVDYPATTTPLDGSDLNPYTFAVNDLDTRVTTLSATVAAIGSVVTSVTSADGTIIMGGTATAPTVKVNAIAESQVTNLTTDLAAKAPLSALNSGCSSGGQWAPNVYGTQFENVERDDVTGSVIMASGFRTWLVLLGLVPAGTYASFKLYLSTAATGTAGVYTCALFGGSSMTNTSWARLGSGNVTLPSLATAGMITTSLAFTLASPTYVALEMVATTAPGTTYPTFAASGAVTGGATFLNPTSGSCPVFGQLNASTAPASTLNPTTGFTNIGQKIWCALA
jgi:hypothetical protein